MRRILLIALPSSGYSLRLNCRGGIVVQIENPGTERQVPTIREVARRAGVSTATASRALNDDHRVAADTKAIVIDAARRLDYRPNLEAVKLGRRGGGVARKRASGLSQ